MTIWTNFSFFEFSFFASSPFEDISQILQKIFQFSSIMFWSDVLWSVFDFVSSNNYLWKFIICNFDISVTIWSFQHIVEWWLIFFYQIILQVQSLRFCFYLKKIHSLSQIQHLLFPDRIWVEVLRNSIFEIFRFSDIQNITFFIFELINSRLMWDICYIYWWRINNEELRI